MEIVWNTLGYNDITDPFDMIRALKDRRSAISYHDNYVGCI